MPSTTMSSPEIRAVYAGRRVAHGSILSLYVRPRADGAARSAVVAGRRVGNAVTRNRAKRRLRALVRLEGLASGFDAVLVARTATAVAPYPELVREYRRLREKAGRS